MAKKTAQKSIWREYAADVSSIITAWITEKAKDAIKNSAYIQDLKRKIKATIIAAVMVLVSLILIFDGLAIFLDTLLDVPSGVTHMILGAIVIIIALIYRKM